MVWGRCAIKARYALLVLTLSFASSALRASSLWYDASVEQYGQILFGSHRLEHAWFRPDIDESARAQSIRSIHTLGYHLHSAHNRGQLQYGLEGAVYIGWDSQRDYRIVLGGEQTSVSVRSDFRSGDVSFGVFTSIKPVPGLRLYSGLGPSLYWGRLPRYQNRDSGQYQSISSGPLIIDNQKNRYDLGVALYARVGAEVIFPNGTSLGFAARKLDATLSFGEHGRVRLGEPQYLFTVGYYYP